MNTDLATLGAMMIVWSDRLSMVIVSAGISLHADATSARSNRTPIAGANPKQILRRDVHSPLPSPS
ncbi:MAG: hypothetical protein M3132_05170 [Actinomycetia bacterium]|nr:hypothetical protein [Actinomycetes bacterium]